MIDGRKVMTQMRALLGEMEAEERGMTLEDVKRLRGLRLPRWLFEVIRELLSGYHERERCIRVGKLSSDVLAEYGRINRAIDDAIGAACFGYDAGIVSVLREDMIEQRGWRHSVVSGAFSERTYYKIKKQCYLYVAAKLNLI